MDPTGDSRQRAKRPPEAISPGRLALIWFFGVLAIGLLLFTYRYLGIISSGGQIPFAKPLINELTASLGAGLLYWAIWALVRAKPLIRGVFVQRIPIYVGALLAFSAAHTSLNWVLRSVLYPLAGQGTYSYGKMPLRYAMEFPIDVIVVTIMVTALHIARSVRLSRQRRLDAAQLQESLTRARLKGLRLQLQPHFLFNTLNTISSTMYRDVDAADEMIQRLADLLRQSLAQDQRDEVPLRDELHALDDYLALMTSRFGDRLRVTQEIADEVLAVRVPSMLLQPLVENAIRHGALESTGAGEIRIDARRQGDSLCIEVWNNGPNGDSLRTGEDDGAGSGLGLAATKKRLRLLYGEAGQFSADPTADGGFLVEITIPIGSRDSEALP